MSLHDHIEGGRRAAQKQAGGLLRSSAPGLLMGLLIGVIAWAQGAPIVALPVAALLSAATGVLARAPRFAETNVAAAWASRLLRGSRRIPKASQFLLIAFLITSVFALELRFDVVPNRYGFLELVLPIALTAVLFEASGGLFCAALTTAYAFKALAPPRFQPIIETQTSFAPTLLTFASVGFFTAIFFAAQARAIPGAGGDDELTHTLRFVAQLRRDAIDRLRARVAQLRTHVLPGAMLVALYALVWATFATISSGRGMHGDSLEAYAWGREFVFGYYKHPPFWSWVAGAWFSVLPKTNWSFWFLSELNGALGLAGAWALIGRFANRRVQMLGVLLLMLTPFYQFNAQRFNANTILLSIWPWTLYFFVRSLETRRILHAFACGLLAGFAILSKYFGLVLIATCFLAALTHDSRARYFRSAAPYVSATVAFLVFAPHLVWLFKDGFQPLIYLSARIDRADRAISNQYFEFIAGNVAFFIIPAALLFLSRRKAGREGLEPKIAAQHGLSFFTVLTFAPFVLTLVAGTVGHAALGIPFAVPIFALTPVWLIMAIEPNLDAAVRYARLAVGVLVAACALAAPVLPYLYLRYDTKHYSEPREEIADAAIAVWKQKTGAPLRFVGGERDFALQVVFRSKDDTSEFNNFNFRWSPWVTPELIDSKGLLILCQERDERCNAGAAAYMREGAKVFDHEVQRHVWSAVGETWRFRLYVIPPAAVP